MEEWAVCGQQVDDLSDIALEYENLQSLLGEDIFPAHESNVFVATEVDRIVGKVVCMKMDCSSCMFLARLPNIIECD